MRSLNKDTEGCTLRSSARALGGAGGTGEEEWKNF